MFLEKIKSAGLAHLSYILGSGKTAAVIDPRRDVDVYLRKAREEGAAIKYVFETHRNEDYVTGSLELAERTGAEIFHGHAMDFDYGNPVSEGDSFTLGALELSVIETPGHTYESISLALYDRETGGGAAGVFTGDALFIGDVGRTDFYPDRKSETAGLLYDSIMEKILPLGDGAMLYPAHGAGSVCGAGMASREFSTLGLERLTNPALQKNREDFIRDKVSERHYYPPYFKKMEEYNKRGARVIGNLPVPEPVSTEEFASRMERGMVAVDARSPEAYAGVHIPGSMAIPLDMMPVFAGWFLPYDKDIGLIVESAEDTDPALRHMSRLGYDRVNTVFIKGIYAWEVSGRQYESIPVVHAAELGKRIRDRKDFTLLDVRGIDEFEEAHLPGALNIYLGELPGSLERIPRDKPVTAFCGSGRRAVIAASILKNNGFKEVENCFGSMQACMETSCGEIAVK